MEIYSLVSKLKKKKFEWKSPAWLEKFLEVINYYTKCQMQSTSEMLIKEPPEVQKTA